MQLCYIKMWFANVLFIDLSYHLFILSFFQLYNTEDLKLEIFKRLLQMSYDFKYTWHFFLYIYVSRVIMANHFLILFMVAIFETLLWKTIWSQYCFILQKMAKNQYQAKMIKKKKDCLWTKNHTIFKNPNRWAASWEILSSRFLTIFDTNQAVQSQRMASCLKFQI